MNKTQLARKAQGLCPYCGEEPVEGKALCEKHLRDSVDRTMRWYHAGGRQQQRQRTNTRREYLRSVKVERGCADCGVRHPAVLDFHHRDPSTKSFALANMVGHSHEDMLEEIEKCVVLCANCHRIRHWEERHGEACVNTNEA